MSTKWLLVTASLLLVPMLVVYSGPRISDQAIS